MRTLFVAMALFLPALAQAQDDVKVPFLFTEDQAIPQTDLFESIKPTDVLRTDPYLNAPMTRLEHMLTCAGTEVEWREHRRCQNRF